LDRQICNRKSVRVTSARAPNENASAERASLTGATANALRGQGTLPLPLGGEDISRDRALPARAISFMVQKIREG
jgi:hypothetical protein